MKQQQIHGRFMALSWRFHGTFLVLCVWICHESAMNLPWNSRFMADSWHFYGAFMALSWHFPFGHVWICRKSAMMKPTCQIHGRFIADSCQIQQSQKKQNHVRFMALSWQFHGTFTYKPYLGTVWYCVSWTSYNIKGSVESTHVQQRTGICMRKELTRIMLTCWKENSKADASTWWICVHWCSWGRLRRRTTVKQMEPSSGQTKFPFNSIQLFRSSNFWSSKDYIWLYTLESWNHDFLIESQDSELGPIDPWTFRIEKKNIKKLGFQTVWPVTLSMILSPLKCWRCGSFKEFSASIWTMYKNRLIRPNIRTFHWTMLTSRPSGPRELLMLYDVSLVLLCIKSTKDFA